jgi:hypothetical protein
MRRLAIAMLSAAFVASAAAGADAAVTGSHSAHAKVAPRIGTPSTRFAVRFHSPERTGTFTGVNVWETVSAVGPKSTTSCSGTAGTRARAAAAGAKLRVRLAPMGKPWCPGSYAGTVSVYRETHCPPGPVTEHRVCPLLAYAPQRIGHFRFTVRRAKS